MNQPVEYLNSLFQSDENAARFRETFSDFFPALIYVYDLNSKQISYLNNKVSDLGGEDVSLKKDSLSALVFQADIDFVQNELQKIIFLKDKESHTFISRFNVTGESSRVFKNVGRVFQRDQEGTPLSLLCLAEDVTDRIKKEEEAVATRQLFSEAEKLLMYGTWSMDATGTDIKWTDGMFHILEYQREDVSDFSLHFFTQHILPEHIEDFNRTIEKAILDKKGFAIEYMVRTKTGREKFVYTKGEAIQDSEGNVKRIIGITRDITTNKNAEQGRERIIRELNKSNKELEEFAYVASHDLNEPVRKILTFCDRIRTKVGTSLDKDVVNYVERINASAQSMRALISNLLEFSRLTRVSESFGQCDLNTVLDEVMADQELRIEETATTFKVKSLPVIEAVSSEMRQLFNNLIGNALKFRKKSVAPVVTISCKRLNHKEKSAHFLPFDQVFYQINVEDNGIGFEPEYGEKIFEIFQQLHGKAEYSGTGIGLAICKKIIDNHEGIIYATSEPGTGSVFSIILPERQFH
ncbi:MAG TPA: ATP-binding protein [Ohtaekwangia sp.]|nr:ATP-binding protein [Ohtaekwangia sp.]